MIRNLKVKSCKCEGCKRTDKAKKMLDRLPTADRRYWENIYLALEMAELDRDVNACIIDGSWPGADETISYARKKAEQAKEPHTA